MADRPTESPTALPTAWSTNRPTSQWLTFAQAGSVLGLSAEAVRSRSRRAGWRTMPGNDGRTLVMLPESLVVEPRPPGRPPERPTGGSVATDRSTEALIEAVATLQAAQGVLSEQLVRERGRADRAVDRVGLLVTQTEGLHELLLAAEAKLTDAERRLAGTEQAKEAARKEVHEMANRVMVLQRDADRSEAQVAALTDENSALQVDLTVARADGQTVVLEAKWLRGELQDAQEAVRAARERLAAMERAETARQGRGLLARLRDALRGQ
jgi:hypothetical protein